MIESHVVFSNFPQVKWWHKLLLPFLAEENFDTNEAVVCIKRIFGTKVVMQARPKTRREKLFDAISRGEVSPMASMLTHLDNE